MYTNNKIKCKSIKMKLNGKWSLSKSESYLNNTVYPLRLSFVSSNGYPLVVSLWYTYIEGKLWLAVQKDSIVAKNLKNNHKCGFEIGPNEPPYMGIRGQGKAILVPEKGEEKLRILVKKYLDIKNQKLSKWLLSRAENEVAICIKPFCLYTWDYSSRMK